MEPRDAVHVMVGYNWFRDYRGLWYPSCPCKCHRLECETCSKFQITDPQNDLFLVRIALAKGLNLMSRTKVEEVNQFFGMINAHHGNIDFLMLSVHGALYERIMKMRNRLDLFYMKVTTYAVYLGAQFGTSQVRLDKAYELLQNYERLGANPPKSFGGTEPTHSEGPKVSRFEIMSFDDD